MQNGGAGDGVKGIPYICGNDILPLEDGLLDTTDHMLAAVLGRPVLVVGGLDFNQEGLKKQKFCTGKNTTEELATNYGTEAAVILRNGKETTIAKDIWEVERADKELLTQPNEWFSEG